jgi:hypothetical protein
MTTEQRYAIAHPVAEASGHSAKYLRVMLPWRIILTVNK